MARKPTKAEIAALVKKLFETGEKAKAVALADEHNLAADARPDDMAKHAMGMS